MPGGVLQEVDYLQVAQGESAQGPNLASKQKNIKRQQEDSENKLFSAALSDLLDGAE